MILLVLGTRTKGVPCQQYDVNLSVGLFAKENSDTKKRNAVLRERKNQRAAAGDSKTEAPGDNAPLMSVCVTFILHHTEIAF